jgi:hypothetical protein
VNCYPDTSPYPILPGTPSRRIQRCSSCGFSYTQNARGLTIRQIYKLPQSSLAELARNSVVQSGFEMEIKRHWIGPQWYLPGAAGNDINKVNFSLYSPLFCAGTCVIRIDECPGYPLSLPPSDVGRGAGHDSRKNHGPR